MGGGGWFYVPKVRAVVASSIVYLSEAARDGWEQMNARRSLEQEGVGPHVVDVWALCFRDHCSHHGLRLIIPLNILLNVYGSFIVHCNISTGMDAIGWLVGQSETLEAQHGRGLWRDRVDLGGYFYRFGQQGTLSAAAAVEDSVPIVAQVRH
jgi:hypothetical protein